MRWAYKPLILVIQTFVSDLIRNLCYSFARVLAVQRVQCTLDWFQFCALTEKIARHPLAALIKVRNRAIYSKKQKKIQLSHGVGGPSCGTRGIHRRNFEARFYIAELVKFICELRIPG